MATQSEIEAYQQVIDGLSTVAFAQIKALLQSLDNPNPIAFRDALLATYPELMRPFIGSASDVAAQWYKTLRTNAGISSSFRVVPAQASVDQLEAGLRYSLSPLFQPEKFIGSDVLSMLAGFSQKMIANSGRDTISETAFADPVRTGWARVPRAGCCAFCGLLASRGAVYLSSASAGGVVGRGVDASVTAGKRGGQGKGVKARGSRELQASYHDSCRCVVTPLFPGADNSYVEYTTKYFDDIYRDTPGEKLSDYSRRNPDGPQFNSQDLKSTLANWRKANGTK